MFLKGLFPFQARAPTIKDNMLYVYVNCNLTILHHIFQSLLTHANMPTYTITELSREFDITPRAIRFYEDQGLISPKREGAGGRTRVYTARERTRLKAATAALAAAELDLIAHTKVAANQPQAALVA